MERAQVEEALRTTGEAIADEAGNLIGYVAQPAIFKLERDYLARGGFLVVTRDEETGWYLGTEYDALKEPRSRKLYPAGHSERAWEAATLEEAVNRVMAALAPIR